MVAGALCWNQVSGSGSRPNHPGDVICDDWLGECKTHCRPNQPIKFVLDVWMKLCDEATSQFKRPAYFVDDGSQRSDKTWVMILDTFDFEGMGCAYVPFPTRVNDCSISFDSDLMNKFVDQQSSKYSCDMCAMHTRFGRFRIVITTLNQFSAEWMSL